MTMNRNEFLKILNKMAKAIERQDFDEPFVGPPSDLDNFNLNDTDETLAVTDLGLWDLLSEGYCSERLRDDAGAPQIYLQGLKKIKLITNIHIEEVRDLFANNKMQNWVISMICKNLIIRSTRVNAQVVKDLIEKISSPEIIPDRDGDISLHDLGEAIEPNPFYSSCIMRYFELWSLIKKSVNRIYGFPPGSQPIEELKPLLKSNDISITNKAEQTVFIGILKCIKDKLDELERAI